MELTMKGQTTNVTPCSCFGGDGTKKGLRLPSLALLWSLDPESSLAINKSSMALATERNVCPRPAEGHVDIDGLRRSSLITGDLITHASPSNFPSSLDLHPPAPTDKCHGFPFGF